MKKIISKNISKINIHFKQPQGLHIIAIITFCICISVAPFIALQTQHGNINFFYNRNDQIFIIFFAGIFGCISNYFLGSTKSIIHGLQLIILAILLSFIRNIEMFSSAVLWVGLAIVIVNLLLNLSSFYLKTDLRRLYGFIGVYSSAILGIAIGILLKFILFNSFFHFKVFYLLVIISLLVFFLKNSYKLNTSLTSQTERINLSFYGVFVVYFCFALILFYLTIHIKLFSLINLLILPTSLIILHTLTIMNNKENGAVLLKYVYFSIILLILNKLIFLSFLKYETGIYVNNINTPLATVCFLLVAYILCLCIYAGWRFKLITLKVESIIDSSLIRTMLYIETLRIGILVISIFSANDLISNILFILATILGLILSIFIIPIYFSLGKILAGGKNEIFTTVLLFMVFSSLIFVSLLYDLSCNLNFSCNF